MIRANAGSCTESKTTKMRHNFPSSDSDLWNWTETMIAVCVNQRAGRGCNGRSKGRYEAYHNGFQPQGDRAEAPWRGWYKVSCCHIFTIFPSNNNGNSQTLVAQCHSAYDYDIICLGYNDIIEVRLFCGTGPDRALTRIQLSQLFNSSTLRKISESDSSKITIKSRPD